MFLNWRQRLAQRPILWQFDQWPQLTMDSIQKNRRKTFLRNQQIIVATLSGEQLKTIARTHNVSPGRITQLLNRCLSGDEANLPPLTSALVPFNEFKSRQRVMPLPTLGNNIDNNNGAFQALLHAVPGLKVGLDAIIKDKLNDKKYAQSLTAQGFHGMFKNLLADAHWAKDCYPYTQTTEVYESLRLYLHRRVEELQHEKECNTFTASSVIGHPKEYRALKTTQSDEHTLDMTNKVHLLLNDELIPLRLGRACVLVTIDVDTHCILGYHRALTKHPNQQDMLSLLDNCITPWQPMELTTPGLSYMKGAGFPSGSTDVFPITFGTMQLDNALMHRALSIIDFLCEQQGGSLSYGHPATPTVRALVEGVFNYIAKKVTHRFASTCGSHPTDKKKESRKNQKKTPTVSLRTLDEALSVVLSEYNVTPQAALGYAKPLDLFRHHCQNHYIPYVPALIRQQWHPLLSQQTVPIHWSQDGHRAPYINFMYEQYKGTGLWQALPNNKKITIRFDRRDIRHLHAYTMKGDDLGELNAPMSWQRFAHSLATRQVIHERSKTYRYGMRDPLSGYFKYLLDNRDKPSKALQMVRVYEEYTHDGTTLILDKPVTVPISPSSASNLSPQWHSGLAKHRR